MKTFILFAFVACSMSMVAQPVLQNGNNMLPVGTVAPLYRGEATGGIGNPGPNQIWDFSSIPFSDPGLVFSVVSPSATPFSSSYPSSNYAWTFSLAGQVQYFYFKISDSKYEVLADNVVAPGVGNDFTPNPKTSLKFPFNYNETYQDTFQKVGGVETTVTVTYDGYGTLITPKGTHTNVMRIKEDRGNGQVGYTWMTVDPLTTLLGYTQSNNSLALFGTYSTSSDETDKNINLTELIPNPAKNKTTLKISDYPILNTMKLNVLNVLGQIIKTVSISASTTEIELDNLTQGIYFYQLHDGSSLVASGKIIVE
ncbi:MAG: T9SS type A sorting domain-containing protein [Ignavibacteria bacterium]|nr:T9SS type A sorting domain-containing protein [Ignavibacteria bacterium]